ncbi:ATP-binding protein [Sporosarcina sp. ITBMC105]
MNQNTTLIDKSYVPAHLAIEAMRDNGYKNTAYAVAELIDNSIQANANYVQLMCKEVNTTTGQRSIAKIEQLAVLDNGDGMNRDVLKLCLQFGNGTRLNKNQRTGIGRFGMGLPASSISQCTRVDVWSWQNGVENAGHVFLDIAEIKQRKTNEIPEVTSTPIPDLWKEKGYEFGESGTLVVWSNLDRMMWSKGQTLVNHSEQLIGRMYRKFLYDGSIKINFTIFNDERNVNESTFALPNDPLYLMAKTSCPEPFNNRPMFEPYMGEDNFEKIFDIPFQGNIHKVFVRASHARDEAREGVNAGGRPHGKHANKNLGISILRAGRELDMDLSLVNNYDPTERWWGIEIEFPPSLDELMGVSNNKQSARNLTDVLSMMDEIKKEQDKGTTLLEIIEEYTEEGDPRAPLIEVCEHINRLLHNHLRKIIKGQNQGSRVNLKRHQNDRVETEATNITEVRKQKGYYGTSDADENQPLEKRRELIIKDLVESGLDNESAEEAATEVVTKESKYSFIESPFEGDAFFTVRTKGGKINILLNKSHPAYENLLEVLDERDDENSVPQLKKRLEKASDGLKLLLAAWARYEDETPDGPRRDDIQGVRQDWGRYSKEFLRRRD